MTIAMRYIGRNLRESCYMKQVSDRGVLVIVSSPSGAGKTTLTRRLIDEFRPQLEFSVSYTTRSMRPGEVNGRDYFFVTSDTFEKMVLAGEFAEHAEVFNNRYGTAQGQIDHALAAGHDIIFDVDWQGGQALSTRWPQDSLKIFILPPDMATLEARLRSRATDSTEVIERRIRKAKDELAHYPEYQHLIVNDELDHAYDTLRATYLTRRYGSVDRSDISHPLAALAAKISDSSAAIAHARSLLA
jgi:guanylate kinase